MKATELRIGNLVQTNQAVFKVDSIDRQGVMLMPFFTDESHEVLFNERLEPIPLTEEWLKRFGCELIVFDITKGDIGFDFWLVPKWSDYSVSVNLEHVHQLQNLYFALTGEEIKCS